ncbi:GGDEF domain-containing protein [Brucepastera parasyntrophica]|uniref:bifunctional diguanylate cyclase/phosphodiesterase n=1 Tax=Brucepastera parasyntrophica TaxID=2880008 RepID=UPI00210E684D|nr:GGDEF domain-containing protein [Brucepastera parasyntrophica]ULQ60471.1 GGDEF domain-containing protein [Brucepastera parasyntrophica]
MKKLKISNYTAFIIAGSVFVAFLISCLFFIHGMKKRNEAETSTFLTDETSQMQTTIHLRIENDFQTVRAFAVGLAASEISGNEKVRMAVQQFTRSNNFIRAGLSDADGNIDFVYSNGLIAENVNTSFLPFFSAVMNGEEVFADPVFDPDLNEYVYTYAVPVRQDGNITGALYAALSGSFFSEIISTPLFRGSGYYAVINNNGIVMLPGADPNPKVVTGASIFDIGDFTDTEHEQIISALTEGRPGSFSFTIDSVMQMVTLHPLGINEWAVISVIGLPYINARYNVTVAGAAVLLAVACFIFLFLMYWQLHTQKGKQTELETLAYTDRLTGARNFLKFEIDAGEIVNKYTDKRFALWTFDTKNFSRINNIFGNEKGNKVLQRVSSILGANNSKDTIHCRISADLFAGIRPYQHRYELEKWFDEVIATLAKREVIADNQMQIDDAMGVYCIEDFDAKISIADMVNKATLAKKAAKVRAGNVVMFYDKEMGDSQRWKTELEARGKQAVVNGEFTFFLQPKVFIQSGYHIAGAEVLVRWNYPEHGWISPGDFIPLFENNGFIIELDRYTFEKACKWYADRSSRERVPVRLAVNVSRQCLLRDDFLEFYTAIKDKYGIPDYVLELEFTESVILDDYDLFYNTVVALRRNGFICSIDDFGAGYSSLNVLKNLPIDVLKLDALFFRKGDSDAREQIVIENFIRMAKELNIKTVAEGVETSEQVVFLQNIGCDMIQGYIFSKPLPQDEFEILISNSGGEFLL